MLVQAWVEFKARRGWVFVFGGSRLGKVVGESFDSGKKGWGRGGMDRGSVLSVTG